MHVNPTMKSCKSFPFLIFCAEQAVDLLELFGVWFRVLTGSDDRVARLGLDLSEYAYSQRILAFSGPPKSS